MDVLAEKTLLPKSLSLPHLCRGTSLRIQKIVSTITNIDSSQVRDEDIQQTCSVRLVLNSRLVAFKSSTLVCPFIMQIFTTMQIICLLMSPNLTSTVSSCLLSGMTFHSLNVPSPPVLKQCPRRFVRQSKTALPDVPQFATAPGNTSR